MATTSRRAIAAYWATGEGADRAPLLAAHIDMSAPACFACDAAPPCTGSEVDRWQASGLERAHIVSAELGGEDDPCNLILLCAACHAAAPMVSHAAPMLRWIVRHESEHQARVAACSRAARDIGLTIDGGLLAHVEAIAAHVPQAMADLGAGSHGGRLSPATVALIAARAVELWRVSACE